MSSCTAYLVLIIVIYVAFKLYQKHLASKNNYIKDSVIVISGASEGIGAKSAELLVAAGEAKEVHLLARSTDKLTKLKASIESTSQSSKTKLFIHTCDCSNIDQVKQVHDAITKQHGSIPNILLHCAGIGKWRFLHEMDYSEIINCLDAPAKASILLTRAFLPDMLTQLASSSPQQANKKFIIASLQSPVAYSPWAGATAYSITRWALRGFNETLRQDFSSISNLISVQEIVAGETDSQYFVNNPGSHERLPAISKLLPVSSPEQVARATLAAIKTGSNGVFYYPFIIGVLQYVSEWMPSVVSFLVAKTGHQLDLKKMSEEKKQQ